MKTDADVVVLDPNGEPMRAPENDNCPRCGCGSEKRVASGGFGLRHDVCSNCGHEFEEFTCHD